MPDDEIDRLNKLIAELTAALETINEKCRALHRYNMGFGNSQHDEAEAYEMFAHTVAQECSKALSLALLEKPHD